MEGGSSLEVAPLASAAGWVSCDSTAGELPRPPWSDAPHARTASAREPSSAVGWFSGPAMGMFI